jgi:hypothetical protein
MGQSEGSLLFASLRGQVRRNLVAIISLVLAILSLSYNTWRNEVTEHNRNVRQAGFEILLTLGEVHQVVFFMHYDKDEFRGNPRLGWAKVLLVEDLATIMPPPVAAAASTMTEVWGTNWSALGEDELAAQRVSRAVDEVRAATIESLSVLR